MAKNLNNAINLLKDSGLEFEIKDNEAVATIENSNKFSEACIKLDKINNMEASEEGNMFNLNGSTCCWKLYDNEENEYDVKAIEDFDSNEYKVVVC